jgi:Asp-tRNA(Asn)/Glu-tRNA(Gln) amidotransferase A subunit family amidase
LRASLERIDTVNEKLNCFCFVYHEESVKLAWRAERKLTAEAEIGTLHGIPFGVKDVTPVAGKRMTRGSPVYEYPIPNAVHPPFSNPCSTLTVFRPISSMS